MDIVTACTLDCSDSCSLLVQIKSNGDVKIKGNPSHPFTAGFTCARMRRFHRRSQSPNRITTPLLREKNNWKAIEWKEALRLCTEKVQLYRHEPESILHINGDGDMGVLGKINALFFSKLGASQVSGSLCDSAGIAACISDYGSLETNDILDLVHARRIVNWGKDLARSSIHVAGLVRKARQKDAQVLSISPGGDGNLDFSDESIHVRPGTDRFLAAAVIKRLLLRDKIDDNILNHAENWADFSKLISNWSISDLVKACDVSEEKVELLYNVYSNPEPVATLLGWGLQRYRYGGENVRFINALSFLSGNIGRTGGGSYFNISSKRNFNLDWAKPSGESNRRTLLVPKIGQDILDAHNPPINMIWVNGFNPVNQAPDSNAIASAFAATPFKVVVDAFMTDTAEQANLILPCELMLEKEDIVGSFLHNYVNYVRPVFTPPENARSDFWILSELGKRLDPPVILPHAEDCLRASLDSLYLNISLEALRQKGFIRANRPEIAYADLNFDHRDGKYHFPVKLHEETSSPPEFPLRLLTLVRRNHIHSQILPEEHDSIPSVWVSPESHGFKGLDVEKDVYLTSPLGRLKVKVKLALELHPDTVIYRRGDWMKLGGGANQLIAARLTDMGDCAAFYDQYVRLEN